MKWPWSTKVEERASYTETIRNAILVAIAGTEADVATTAALECAAGHVSRALCAARVEADGSAAAAITPAFMLEAGRALVRSGESLHVIRTDPEGGVKLVQSSSWEFAGGTDRASWTVIAELAGPTSGVKIRSGYEGIVYLQWANDPRKPHQGIGPMGWASQSGRMAAEAEKALADELSGPRGSVVPVPAVGDEGLDELQRVLTELTGGLALTETTAAGYGAGAQDAPKQDLVPRRLGANPPQGVTEARRQAFESTLAACGVPPSLCIASADGTSQREGQRRLYLQTIIPLAKAIATELTAKLETDVAFHFDLYNVDLAGRAQAFQKLVAGGMAVAEATALSGLLSEDG